MPAKLAEAGTLLSARHHNAALMNTWTTAREPISGLGPK